MTMIQEMTSSLKRTELRHNRSYAAPTPESQLSAYWLWPLCRLHLLYQNCQTCLRFTK